MKLADWLDRERMKRKDFAEKIGVNPSYVTAICAGQLWPGHDIAARIKDATGGEVMPNDFLAIAAE